MKLNWGTGIFLAFVIFVIITLVMVFYLMNQDVNLVANDYYKQEIEYQNHIEMVKRTNALPESLKIIPKQNLVVLKFPSIFAQTKIKGNIFFYRPSDRTKDVTIPLALNDNNEQIIPTSLLIKGMWKIQVKWEDSESTYFNEKIIMVN